MDMPYSQCDINKKALYVLREDDFGKFHAEYLPIQIDDSLPKSIKNLLENMQEKTNDNNLSKQDIYNIKTQMILDYWEDIQRNHSYLLGYRNYCTSISSSYISSPEIPKDLDFLPFSEDSNDVRIKRSENDYTRIEYIFSNSLFESYFIEQAYDECRNNKNIKAYSHRRLGWESYDFDLNNLFSIRIKTNFGYGYANYFCVTLIFDGIQIIPYSRLVIYYNANYMQIIRNTWDFYVQDDSWELAFNLVKDACNTYRKEGQNSIIKQYFVNELENLTTKLHEYLYIKEFKLSENQYGYRIDRNEKVRKVVLDGFPLIVFRGEKVSGAVGFVESIKKINKIMPIQKYIDIIIDCCKKVLLQIDSALNELNSIIEKLENIYKEELEKREQLESLLNEIASKIGKYDESEQNIKNDIYELTKEDEEVDYQKRISLINEKMLKKHPDLEETRQEYHNRKREFDSQKSKCSDISSDIYTHNSYLSKISEYKEKIDLFIEKQ